MNIEIKPGDYLKAVDDIEGKEGIVFKIEGRYKIIKVDETSLVVTNEKGSTARIPHKQVRVNFDIEFANHYKSNLEEKVLELQKISREMLEEIQKIKEDGE